MLGLHFCARAFSSCGKQGPLFIVVRGPLTVMASLVAEHRLQTRMLSSCGSRTQLLRGMWDLPRPGLEPVSPVLAGRFSTTVPPGKPPPHFCKEEASKHFGHFSGLLQEPQCCPPTPTNPHEILSKGPVDFFVVEFVTIYFYLVY